MSERWAGLSKSGWIKAGMRAAGLVAQQDRRRKDGTLVKELRHEDPAPYYHKTPLRRRAGFLGWCARLWLRLRTRLKGRLE